MLMTRTGADHRGQN